MEKLSQIEQYLSGEMPEAEKNAFEAEIQQDTQLQEEVAAYRDVMAGIERAGERAFAASLQKWEQQIQAENNIQSGRSRRLFSPQAGIAIAAAVVLLLSFIFILKSTTPTGDPFQQAFQPYPDEITVMGEGQQGFNQQKANEAMGYYNEGVYDEALPLLRELSNEHPDIPVLKLYTGISSLQLQDYDYAQELFLILQNESPSYKAAADWYEALLHLKSGNTALAEEKLTEISKTDGHSYQAQARELLRDL